MTYRSAVCCSTTELTTRMEVMLDSGIRGGVERGVWMGGVSKGVWECKKR